MLSFIGILLLIILLIIVSSLESEIKKNKSEIAELKEKLNLIEEDLYKGKKPIKTPRIEIVKKEPEKILVKAELKEKEPEIIIKQKTEKQPAVKAPAPVIAKPKKKKKKSAFLIKLEQNFIENWIGIIGSIVLIIGLGILGIYAMLKLSAFYKFLMLCTVSAVLLGAFFFLKRRNFWLQLALLLRSSSAAIFLFACFCAGGVPGLQWIYNPLYALLLLLAAIIINLYLAWAGSSQLFASMHVLLSLVSIAVAPQNLTLFFIAGIIAAFGIILIYKEKWEHHLLFTISSYFVYIVYFKLKTDITAVSARLGILTVICIIYSLALLIHYRKIYSEKVFNTKAFISHLLSWLYLSIGILSFSIGTNIIPLLIILASALIFFIARYARSLNIKWLYITDTLIAQITAVTGIMALSRFEFNYETIACLVFLEMLAFSIVMYIEKNKALFKTGIIFQNLLILTLPFVFLTKPGTFTETILNQNIFLMVLSITALSIFHLYIIKKKSLIKQPHIFSEKYDIKILAGIIITSLLILLSTLTFKTISIELAEKIKPEYFLVALGTIFIFTKNSFENKRTEIISNFASQTAAYLLAASLYKHNFSYFQIYSLILIETAAFTSMHIFRKNNLLVNTGLVLSNILSVLLMISYTSLNSTLNIRNIYINSAVLFVVFIIMNIHIVHISGRLTAAAKKQKPILFNLLAFMGATLITVIYINIYKYIKLPEYLNASYIILLPVLSLILIRNKYTFAGTGIALIICIAAIHIGEFRNLYKAMDEIKVLYKIILSLPLLIISYSAVKFSYIKEKTNSVKWPGIYLLYTNIAFLSYIVFKPVSPLIPGIIWLIISVLNIEAASYLKKIKGDKLKGKTDLYILQTGFLFILAFLIRHILVHLQSERFLFNLIRIRALLEIYFASVVLYWLTHKSKALTEYKLYSLIKPLLLELLLLFSVFSAVLEFRQIYHPAIWIISAIACLFIGHKSEEKFSRLFFYSFIFFWASCFHVAFVTSPYVSARIDYISINWLVSVGAIIMQFVYLPLFYRKIKTADIKFPQKLEWLNNAHIKITAEKNLWFIYPLIISVFLFLVWSFSRSVLTFLLSLECFAVFIISIILRENHFRYLSTAGLLGCILRLFFYDLAKANTVTKAVVFIGVALLMLSMNALYNKYKERFIRK